MTTSNDFILKCGEISSIDFEGPLEITEGQTSSSPQRKCNGSSWKITVLADRKSSKSVAESFNRKTGGKTYEYTNASGDRSPKELNFYFGVKITFKINDVEYPVTVYLGQGHYTVHNNWWIGGNPVIYPTDGKPVLCVISSEGKIMRRYTISGDDSYTMTLSPF